MASSVAGKRRQDDCVKRACGVVVVRVRPSLAVLSVAVLSVVPTTRREQRAAGRPRDAKVGIVLRWRRVQALLWIVGKL